MQALIGDILAYSRLAHIEDGFEMVSSKMKEKNAVVEFDNLPHVKVAT